MAGVDEKMPPSDESQSEKTNLDTDSRTLSTEAEQTHSPEQHSRSDVEYNAIGQKNISLFQKLVVVGSMGLAIFLVSLDRIILATAIPTVTDEFHSLDDVGWYASAFLLTSCSLLLPITRIFVFYSPKWVYLTMVLLFEIGSAICGAAPNSTALIVGRAIAGIGGAGILPGGVILLNRTVPLDQVPKYTALFGIAFGVSISAGPFIGGALTSAVSWRWCFYINLPIGALTLAIIAFVMEPTPALRTRHSLKSTFLQLDPLGTLCLLPGLISLLLALQWGGSTYPWSDGRIIALFVVFAVLAVAFIVVQITMQDTAMIPSRIFTQRSILSGQLYTFCLISSMFITWYYVPIWFQIIKGSSPLHAGVQTFPMVFSVVVGVILAGVGTKGFAKGFYTPFAYVGVVLGAIGTGLLSTWNRHTAHPAWIGIQVLTGLGFGMGFQQPILAAQTVLKEADVPIGVGLVQFAQILGGAVFVSVCQSMTNTWLASQLPALIPGLDARTIGNLGANEIRSLAGPNLDAVLDVYNVAFQRTFYLAAGLAAGAVFGALGLEWISVVEEEKKKKEEQQARLTEEGR